MSNISDDPLDRLWQEYEAVFRDFDDLMLARWMAQTLGQLEGRAWRLSHPLVGAYRLAANHAHTLAHQHGEPIVGFAQVGRRRGQEDVRRGQEADHGQTSSTSSNRRNESGSNRSGILSDRPPTKFST
jgi:hypothetical protein